MNIYQIVYTLPDDKVGYTKIQAMDKDSAKKIFKKTYINCKIVTITQIVN